ncbi:hypothetical protein HDU80_009564 [Chytriomyces hyalinus]|nr:hypothetical protein HDU80_009564 [Chytriomyces hyalinus]
MSKRPKKVKLDGGWLSTNIGISGASNPMRPRSVEQQAAKETLRQQLLLLQQRNKADDAPNLGGEHFTACSTDLSNDELDGNFESTNELDSNFESTNNEFIPTADAPSNLNLEFDVSDYETDSAMHDGDSLESRAFYKTYFGLPPALKSQPTMYAANMRETMQGFQSIESELLASYSLLITPNLSGTTCCHLDVQDPQCNSIATARCSTCRSILLESTYCANHAELHAHKYMCHFVESATGSRIISPSEKHIRCCSNSRLTDTSFHVKLHLHAGIHSTETVKVLLCSQHENKAPPVLMDNDHAFAISMTEIGIRMREKGVSYQSGADVLMSDECQDARHKNVYVPFKQAVRQFASLPHRVRHGILTEAAKVKYGDGKTGCAACEGTTSSSTPFAFTIDGFSSAKHISPSFGGGGNHGWFQWAKSCFYLPGKDYVAAAKGSASHIPTDNSDGCSNFRAGLEDEKKSSKITDIDMIVHMDCRHDCVLRIFDAEGEKLIYAHGRDCQCRYGPHVIMGLGLTMNGEGHERANARLSRSIGLTTHQTLENRQLDIALVVEDYNRGKRKSFVGWTEKALTGSFSLIADLLSKISTVEPYAIVVAKNSAERRLIARNELRTSDGNYTDMLAALELKIRDHARVIISLENKLNQKQGTEATTRLQSSRQSSYKAAALLISSFNEQQNQRILTFADVKADVILKKQEDPQITLWRHLEDVYHHLAHTANLQDFFSQRKEVFWIDVEQDISAMENSKHQEAATFLMNQCSDHENLLESQAKQLENKFRHMMPESNLNNYLLQIDAAFSDGTLKDQNVFNIN